MSKTSTAYRKARKKTLSRQNAGAAHAKGDSTAVQIEVQQQRLHALMNLENDLRLCCNRYTFEASLRFYLDGRRRQLRTARAVNGERVLGSSDEELTATIARVIFLDSSIDLPQSRFCFGLRDCEENVDIPGGCTRKRAQHGASRDHQTRN